ncbi:hypothetical protein J2Z40_000026 [Cytobacillus eiseniae]|uniref:Pullulanase n=1 Tax=Cytobacillus eiseniae TaxID=762947 RepID=A0ABS4R9A0_9BACI|nr:DUF6509 family protein [Cytobacillus eiseniae]MBP2239473.1 hypothetical protein [Cytobacillus eiseniae]
MKITSFSVEQLIDPTGILIGDRFEFFLDIEVDEDDELYSENGVQLRVLFYKNEDDSRILNYHFLSADTILEFALDEEEEKEVTIFCNNQLLHTEE